MTGLKPGTLADIIGAHRRGANDTRANLESLLADRGYQTIRDLLRAGEYSKAAQAASKGQG